MRITRVYTRSGDDGSTRLGGGGKVSKDSRRTEAYGTVDELNSCVGWALAGDLDRDVREELRRIQNDLFHLGADLCLREEEKKDRDVPRIEARHVERLERFIDRLQPGLGPLEEFILPGGAPAAAALHLARAVCRRAERTAVALSSAEEIGAVVIPYLNRLSDALFVMARRENQRCGEPEPRWEKDA
ncbi:MAG: cob(I)yrinic acid a,c-diamide adenosyltransferase [Planctomycetes bacterium]|nr:cob(I)yrinic acid a,c-diamide adenosyltransferase [Planctomycetota bacterium]